MENKLLCGIDEAGRGPLAGPLVMAGVILNECVEGLADSKKLSEKRREALYLQIIAVAQYHIVIFSHQQIDENGISKCLQDGLEQIKASLSNATYLFDGNTAYGVAEIETMVKADAKVPEVSAASILSKVTRDRIMYDSAVLYPEYGFEVHKGYGTSVHIEAMRRHGRCAIHRKRFRVKALDVPTLF